MQEDITFRTGARTIHLRTYMLTHSHAHTCTRHARPPARLHTLVCVCTHTRTQTQPPAHPFTHPPALCRRRSRRRRCRHRHRHSHHHPHCHRRCRRRRRRRPRSHRLHSATTVATHRLRHRNLQGIILSLHSRLFVAVPAFLHLGLVHAFVLRGCCVFLFVCLAVMARFSLVVCPCGSLARLNWTNSNFLPVECRSRSESGSVEGLFRCLCESLYCFRLSGNA